jgi:hypothetical protein
MRKQVGSKLKLSSNPLARRSIYLSKLLVLTARTSLRVKLVEPLTHPLTRVVLTALLSTERKSCCAAASRYLCPN